MSKYQTLLNMDPTELKQVIHVAVSIRDAVKLLGFKDDPRARKFVVQFAQQHGIDTFDHTCKKYNTTWSEQDLREAVAQSYCMTATASASRARA